MKKKLSFTINIILICLIFGSLLLSSCAGDSSGPLNAMRQIGRHVDRIIHQETVKNGVIVFYKTNVGGDDYTINADFVKKGLFGWQWVWGGGYGGAHELYLPGYTGTPFPLLYGDIVNPDTEAIQIHDMSSDRSMDAQIAGPDGERIWFVFPEPADKPAFEITSLAGGSKVLDARSYSYPTTASTSFMTATG